MAIKRPDLYEHNNPNLPIVDSDSVKGGIRSAVQSLSDLYTLTGQAEKLKQHSTQVYVSGQNAFYLLKDINNIGNSNGWIVMTGVGNPGDSVTLPNDILFTTGTQTITGPKNFTARPTLSGVNLITTGDLVNLELQILGLDNIVYTTGNQIINGVKNFASRPTVNETGVTLSGEAVQSNGTITRMIRLTQSQYNALSPKDPTTFYVIVG